MESRGLTRGNTYLSQAAKDAQQTGYGDETYWQYLDLFALKYYIYFARSGDLTQAERMLTRSLLEALQGNDGA